MSPPRPLLALTLGDPAGIGPEVCLKAIIEPEVEALARCVLVGAASVARATAGWLGIERPVVEVPHPGVQVPPQLIPVLSVTDLDPASVAPGELSAAAGRAGVAAVESAARLAMAGQVDAVVTAPLN